MPEQKDRLQAALADRYLLLRELGRGGMATVWLAQDLRQRREVAVKVLNPELSASLGSERFLREIEIASSLTHPHILSVHESGETDGFVYYTMPRVQGESLRDRLHREVQLPVEDALRIAGQVADALGYAHDRGFVHRDVKPENILLDGVTAVVADFGMAKAIETAGGDRLTGTGLAVGTPAYMSPEQGGGAEHLDGRSDIYAMACVLYEMLAGEPPFSARTPQALVAKHLQATPQPIRVVRPTVPVGVERALSRGLAKVPADRFATAREFGQALSVTGQSGSTKPRTWSARLWGVAGLAAVVAFCLVALSRGWLSRTSKPVLDTNRVVVFPLRDPDGDKRGEEQGEAVATYIGYGLDGAEPLKWIDGWDRLGERERTGVAEVTPERAAVISRREGARFYIDGAIVRMPDSLAVVLRLHDVVGDSVVKRSGTTGPKDLSTLPQLGLRAVAPLLPSLLQPGQSADLSSLSERSPAAIASFLLGERSYRRMNFKVALQHYEVALGIDSTFGLAALKGAQAANWQELNDVAEKLVDQALSLNTPLSARYAAYALGLHHFLRGDADSAVDQFTRAIEADENWIEGWTAIGEVYYHLLPNRPQLDSLAETAFRRAERIDSQFTPPLFHLAEIAFRNGDVRRGEELAQRLWSVNADTAFHTQLVVMDRCVRDGPTSVDWHQLGRTPALLLATATSFAGGGKQRACARPAFQAVFDGETAGLNDRWGALLGLQSLLVAEGRFADLRRLLDSERALELGSDLLYLVIGAAGAPVDARAAQVARRFEESSSPLTPPVLWALGLWEVRQRHQERVASIVGTLAAIADSSKSRRDSLISAALSAHLALLQGDSATALNRLAALRPTGTLEELEWQPWESLGPERLALAQLLLARKEYDRASQVAAQFDSPQPVVYPMYLPASLAIRLRAAESVGQIDLVRSYRARLAGLKSSPSYAPVEQANPK